MILGHGSVPSVRYAGELRGNVIDVRVSVLNHLLVTDAERMAAEEKALAQKTASVTATIKAYEPIVGTGEARKLFETFSAAWASSQVETARDQRPFRRFRPQGCGTS